MFRLTAASIGSGIVRASAIAFLIDALAGISLDQDSTAWTLTTDLSMRMRPIPALPRLLARNTIVRQGRRSATCTVDVTGPDGEVRTFTYRPRGDGLVEIRELDDRGRPTRTFLYDPQGKVAADDRGTGGSTGSASSAAPDRRDEDHAGSRAPNWRMIGLVAVGLAALGALIWWLLRRRTAVAAPAPAAAPPWALRLAAQIDHEGAVRGRRRSRSEPLVRYAAELARDPLPDPRVPAVAEVVSDALFGRRDPGPEVQRWAEATWAEVLAAHPAPGRRDRGRAPANAG